MLGISSTLTNQSRILILSQRLLQDQVANSCLYDFEDIIGEFDEADLFALNNSGKISHKIYRTAKSITKSDRVANSIVSFSHQYSLDREYDLLFVVLDNPWQMLSINQIKNWRKKCRKVVCYIAEVWEKDLESGKLKLEPFDYFDLIFLGVSHCTKKLSEMSSRPCIYLPPAVNTLQFLPHQFSVDRNIDIAYLGRRSPITHQSLVDFANQFNLFYYYDTAKDLRVHNYREHRNLFANIVKRSRYFIANYAKIDRKKEETGGKQEIGYRFFEGAAAGTVMLGKPPQTEEFRRYFHWQDAVIEIDVDAPNIGEIIADLDCQPERLERIMKANIANSLIKHDWVYRWEQVLKAVDLPSTTRMLIRQNYLRNLAQSLDRSTLVQDREVSSVA